jgi:hypothetical protein
MLYAFDTQATTATRVAVVADPIVVITVATTDAFGYGSSRCGRCWQRVRVYPQPAS